METTAAKPVTSSGPNAPMALPPAPNIMARFSQRDRDLIIKTLSEPLEYTSHPSFRKSGIEEVLFPAEQDGRPRSVDEMLDPPNVVQTALSTMTAEQERLAFRRYNYARYRVYVVLQQHHRRRLTLNTARELVFWQRRALTARTVIVQANLPLVLAMAKRTRLSGVDFNELISEHGAASQRGQVRLFPRFQVQHVCVPGDSEELQPGGHANDTVSRSFPDGVRSDPGAERFHRDQT